MIGVDHPFPGRATFQRTWSLGENDVGRPAVAECPCPEGPRKSGQPSAPQSPGAATSEAVTSRPTSAGPRNDERMVSPWSQLDKAGAILATR